ncbi:hypothetical protein [Halofilum ochraceum]|uniref:hypothetical protein n=1 Tax=Halofilum ochraceum TaxID=1611323 RepID=UPI00111306EC|nr:hypothetical protein [Halofilum ochraceum]
MRVVSEPTAGLSYVALSGYALIGRAQAIRAVALSWLFTMLSPAIAAETSFSTVGRFLVLGAAIAAVLLRSRLARGRSETHNFVFATVLLGGGIVIHGLLFSSYPAVSVLKAVSWTATTAAMLAAWLGLGKEARSRLATDLFGGLTLLMVFSLPLLWSPLGYLRNGSGFQGILNHPQVFGPTAALLGAWAIGTLVAQRRPSWAITVLVAACLVLVLLSEARTAGIALVLGVGGAVMMLPMMAGKPVNAIAPGIKSRRFVGLASLAVVGMLAVGPALMDRIESYLAKGTSSDTVVEAYYKSRGDLIVEMWGNIKTDPFRGIGFGVASNSSEMKVQRDPLFGLPVAAPIEKGVMPVAVLEELGAPGLLVVAAWVVVLLRRSGRENVAGLAVTLTALLVNMGEYVLFSTGGMGLLLIILIAWAASAPRARRVPS